VLLGNQEEGGADVSVGEINLVLAVLNNQILIPED
jgi:hypothetical protein